MLLPVSLIIFSLLVLLAVSTVVWSLLLLAYRLFHPRPRNSPAPVVALPKHEILQLESDMSFTILPKILYEGVAEEPPDYYDLEEAYRASPLPSYEEIVYHDSLVKSVHGFLSPRN